MFHFYLSLALVIFSGLLEIYIELYRSEWYHDKSQRLFCKGNDQFPHPNK